MKNGIRVKLLAITALAVSAFAQTNPVTPLGSAGTLSEKVRHELVMLPYYGIFDHLAFRVDGDKVTLLGEVSRPTLKTQAERVVKGLPGVTTVDNHIHVLPLSLYDDRLRLAFVRTIFGNPVLSRYSWGAQPPIHFIVENGTLTLKGTVSNEGDRNLAGILANGIPGAFAVNNELVVN
ncbi:MAG TPA: BON domain-containing protein [Bryobacteraceae bacterium]|nr:BON domain-containing protein [Bryobacteraceae bacterium]